jgi:hypothetical protein
MNASRTSSEKPDTKRRACLPRKRNGPRQKLKRRRRGNSEEVGVLEAAWVLLLVF